MNNFHSLTLLFFISLTLGYCDSKNENMSITTIQNWQKLLQKNRENILQLFEGSNEQVEHNVGYEKLKPLDAIFDPSFHPATFYFSGDRVALIYIREQKALHNVNPKDLKSAWGPGIELNSRAGQEMTHIAYPQQGVAFTLEEGVGRIVEIL